MAKLTFTGRSKDGKRLLLVDESGQEHTLAVDARLRRVLRRRARQQRPVGDPDGIKPPPPRHPDAHPSR